MHLDLRDAGIYIVYCGIKLRTSNGSDTHKAREKKEILESFKRRLVHKLEGSMTMDIKAKM